MIAFELLEEGKKVKNLSKISTFQSSKVSDLESDL